MASFWRRWISSYAKIAEPLNELLKKDADFASWCERHEQAFVELKRALVKYPVLRQYDSSKPTTIITDACDYAIGGAILQEHDGTLCPIA
eukprot:SAG11_NODE_27189_length_335_cov_2.588983_1_plen_89_part_01